MNTIQTCVTYAFDSILWNPALTLLPFIIGSLTALVNMLIYTRPHGPVTTMVVVLSNVSILVGGILIGAFSIGAIIGARDITDNLFFVAAPLSLVLGMGGFILSYYLVAPFWRTYTRDLRAEEEYSSPRW